MSFNQRQSNRVNVSFPIQISFGSQITLQGYLKDLSLKSAFIHLKNSIYMQLNDELNFHIESPHVDPPANIQGTARISRIAGGEGIAIYFVKMDEQSSKHLEQLVGVM